MPTTLKLTPGGDLDLRNGRGPVLVTGAEAAQSELIAIFLTQAGEWGYNLEFGVRYNEAILGKFFDETTTAASTLAADASSAPSVSPVPSGNVTFAFDDQTRTLRATISPVLPRGDGDPFAFEIPLGG
jgi:hypothetical protein